MRRKKRQADWREGGNGEEEEEIERKEKGEQR